MLYRILGRTGLKVSVFSYGSWVTFAQMDQQTVNNVIALACENGINLFDTAEIYTQGLAETKLGTALKASTIHREKYLLCSKVFWGGESQTECGLSRKHIIEGCHHSLRRLETSYLDLLLCHRPDPHTEIEETVIAMNILIQQGKILYWGTSEWPIDLIIEAYYVARQLHLIPPSVEQFEYNLFARHKAEMELPRIQKITGVGALTTMPLACGILSGKYNMQIPTESRAKLYNNETFLKMISDTSSKQKISLARELEVLAKSLSISLPQLVLYWCLRNELVTSVIIGARTVEQLTQNLQTIRLFEEKVIPEEIFYKHDFLRRATVALDEPSYATVAAES